MLKLPEHPQNVAQFLERVNQIIREFKIDRDEFGPWYRGQQRSYWGLCPRIYREYGGQKNVSDRMIEDELREEFVIRAPIFSESSPLGAAVSDWEWYFLMQHFGAPTRLLDWTEGALLALFFAIRDNPGFYDAAVWVLDPYELNHGAIGKEEVIPPSAAGVKTEDRRLVAPWLPQRFKKRPLPKTPVAVLPTHTVRRISTQRSCFTVHGSDENGLSALLGPDSQVLRRIVVPSFAVATIRKELDTCGIDEATIFPDLEGLGRSLAARWRPRVANPDAGCHTRLRPSVVHKGGVGVFAIRSIPSGADLFTGENEEMVWLDDDEVLKRKGAVLDMYRDFCVRRKRRYGCPEKFNRLTMAWYLNEPRKGDAPNVCCDPDTFDFKALRKIKAGEELTVDYSSYSDIPVDLGWR